MARVKGAHLPRIKKQCRQKLAQRSGETSAGKSHRGQKLNKWNPENMRREEDITVRLCAIAYKRW